MTIHSRSSIHRFLLATTVASTALAAACSSSVVTSSGTGAAGGTTTTTTTPSTGGSGGSGATGGTATGGTGTGGSTSTTGGTGGTGGGPITPASKVDLLLAVDNSRGMADKQYLLSLAVPDLVRGLVNPPCVDDTGKTVATLSGSLDPCPVDSKRAFAPVLDMHVGVVSSSLGGHGSDACSTNGPGKASNNDKGHLLDRKDPTMLGVVDTYQGLHFLAWDIAQKLVPPGEADLDTDGPDPNTGALLPTLHDMVLGVGEIGCGYESQLEGWYRFLVDPTPYDTLTLDAQGKISLQGTDKTLLDERKSFLRPSSALVVVMITDENDCSLRESGQFYFAEQQKTGNGTPFHLPAPRAICASSPGDMCCFSCGQTGPKDANGNPVCAADPTCKTADGKTVYLDASSDNINLRCFEQKRRFGIDFLNPTDRYVQGLTKSTVTDRNGQIVPNPIFSDLDPSDDDSNVRTADLVFFAGIVGVPWVDIARQNAQGAPDLVGGLDASGKPVGGFQSAAELDKKVAGQSYTGWDLVLGDFAGYGSAKDPFMLESIAPRSGENPITHDNVLPPSTPNAQGNSINGHERSIPQNDDLQLACVFPLVKVDANGGSVPVTRDCSAPGSASCDCQDSGNDSPLCQVDPGTGKPTTQFRAGARPGRRELAVLEGVGAQGVVGSVCPAQVASPAGADFGYRPVVASIIERVKPHLLP